MKFPSMMIGLSLLAACATTGAERVASPPTAWLDQFDNQNPKCLDFNLMFSNEGEQFEVSSDDGYRAYLSELMFARLPKGELPKLVSLDTNGKLGQLRVMLTGTSNRTIDYRVSCLSGWHVLEKSRSEQYLGEGIVEKVFKQVVFFRIGTVNELVVRVFAGAEFNSQFVFESKAHADRWYRFLPVVVTPPPEP